MKRIFIFGLLFLVSAISYGNDVITTPLPDWSEFGGLRKSLDTSAYDKMYWYIHFEKSTDGVGQYQIYNGTSQLGYNIDPDSPVVFSFISSSSGSISPAYLYGIHQDGVLTVVERPVMPVMIAVSGDFIPEIYETHVYIDVSDWSWNYGDTHIVRYQVRNDSPDPVALAVAMVWEDGSEEINTLHVEPQTETEAAATTIHSWAEQNDRVPVSCTVRAYQDGEIVAESTSINFVSDGAGNNVSELHTVIFTPPPLPKLTLAFAAMNGSSTFLEVRANVNTSLGFRSILLSTISAGSYYDPAVRNFNHEIELSDGEIPLSCVITLQPAGASVVLSQELPITNPIDDWDYYASGVVNYSEQPDVEPPPIPADPTDPNPVDPDPTDPVDPVKPPPPTSDPNPMAMDYEKMAQAMEYALNNQKVSGVNDQVKALRKDVQGMTGGDADTGYSDGVAFGDKVVYENLVNENRGQVDSMNWGGVLSSGADRIKAVLARIFTIQLPEIGRANTITFELPACMGMQLPPIHIDLDQLVYVELLRHVLVIALAIWGIRNLMTIFNATFQ